MSSGNGEMNGHHSTNGISQSRSPQPQANGNGAVTEGFSASPHGTKALENKTATTNGITQPTLNVSSAPQAPSIKMDELPEEILEMLRRIPEDAYVPTSRLVERAAQECWSDLVALLDVLAKIQNGEDMRNPEKRVKEEKDKKQKLWDFAEKHKQVLIKLLVILQWSPQSGENRVTIALNFYLHELRRSFISANDQLFEWINYIVTRHDAAPDLDTAMTILAAGRIENLPDLGYAQQRELDDRQILSTIRRLNSILQVRMMAEESIPPPLSEWHIHDGRVTFKVPNEFDLAVSVMDEDHNSKYLMVNVKFNFKPAPSVSQDLLDEITNIVNAELATKGLVGAYNFLHELALSQKLKELHIQALNLTQGLWAGHLRIEMIKRTLVVQYWTRRSSSKSWIELTLNSGRSSLNHFPTPFIGLRWMRHGKLVTNHDIELDLLHLSFENVLNQVIAQHTNFVFDGMYEKLGTSKLFADNELQMDQSLSSTDAFDCSLSIELSRISSIQVTCDPVGGNIVLSPASDRANRFQQELARSKNIVEDFVKRFPALRCGLNQTVLTRAIQNTPLQVLAGRKPSSNEVRELFGPSALRAVFLRQPEWSEDWLLAASFGADGDFWWLVHDPSNGKRSVQKLLQGPIHVQQKLSFQYFDSLADSAAATIGLQTSQQGCEQIGLRSNLPTSTERHPIMKVQLSSDELLESIGRDIVVSPLNSKRVSSGFTLVVLASLKAPADTLSALADAGLDSSMEIQTKKRTLMLRLKCAVGENKMPTAMARLHYIDDLISCIKLVHKKGELKMERLTLKDIVISYYTGQATNLSLALLFEAPKGASRIKLLPEEKNPHCLVSQHIDPTFGAGHAPLSKRLRKLLVELHLTLPLLNALQYLQGKLNPQDVPEMASLDLKESHKWLRMHVIARDMVRFAVHFSAVNASFRKDIQRDETPLNMLVRLEILPELSGSGRKLAWIVRPAIEEFKSYHRQSYTSLDLKQRMKDRIFSATDDQGWIGMDTSASCVTTSPYRLIIAVHDTILEWLKDNIAKVADTPNQPGPDPGPNRDNNAGPTAPGNQPQPRPPIQRQSSSSQQGRPRSMQQNSSGTTRVMTAPPQEVKPPPPNTQRRSNQSGQSRNSNHRHIPNPNDVINLD
ncbi:mediator complex subunit [Knufia obscura]|uniref:Mediator of RNA polymerase II transcription subunit 14 n=1 Tax=Knufia obscura TaxID=1635080 RepID=A0ABR0S2Y6_9EURO|nr:mediator complex subunit [Knufia obscura]